jgi:hypothetical protein
MESELQNLKSNLQKMLSLATGSGSADLVYGIMSQVDVVQQSAARISSAAEVSLTCTQKFSYSSSVYWTMGLD